MHSISPLRKYRSAEGKRLDDLAGPLGVNKSTLSRWERGRVPSERVVEVETLTGIPRQELRPDIFAEAVK